MSPKLSTRQGEEIVATISKGVFAKAMRHCPSSRVFLVSAKARTHLESAKARGHSRLISQPHNFDRRPQATADRRPAIADRRQSTGDRRPATADRRPATTGDRRP